MSDIMDARAKSMVATIEARTGKTTRDFVKLAVKSGLDNPSAKRGAVVDWLKSDFGLGHGHALAMAHAIREALPAAKKA